jgi:hypothetical protein
MTTKAPSPVKAGADESLEKLAYGSVAGIPAADPHDQDRLGYTVWMWLKYHRDSLEQAVTSADARLLVSDEEALKRIRQYLTSHGVTL